MRKKRRKNAENPDTPATPAVAPAIQTSLKGAISDWKAKLPTADTAKATGATKAAGASKGANATGTTARPVVTLPPPGPAPLVPVAAPGSQARIATTQLTAEDRNALARAFAGVKPMAGRKRGGPSPALERAQLDARLDEVAARQRLDALVGQGAAIVVERQDEHVSGLRAGTSAQVLRRLRGTTLRPEATLDLHGERSADVPSLVNKFVRMQHKKGLRVLLIIVGKGHHSDGGVGVLAGPTITALSEGGAAPLVAAFCTAHADRGGSGALMVELVNG